MKTAFLATQYTVLAACIVLWVYRLGVRQREGTLLHSRRHDASPVGILDICATIFIWFVLGALAVVPIYLFMGLGPTELANAATMPPEQMLEMSGWMMLMQLAATFGAIGWLVRRHRRVGWLGEAASFPRDLLIGVSGSLMLIPLVMLIQMVATQFIDYKHVTLDSLAENYSPKSVAWAWISAVGIAPFIEEFFFRGIIQGWLQRVFDYDEPKELWFLGGRANPKLDRELTAENSVQKLYRFWVPIVITSVVFAGVHFGQGPAPIPLFFLSLGLGYLFRKTGSFVPCFVVHLMLNSISMVVLTLSILYPELQPPVDVEPVPAIFFTN